MRPAILLTCVAALLIGLSGGPAVADRGLSQARAQLMKGLRDKDPRERARAVYALDGFDSAAAARTLVKYVIARDDRAQVIRSGLQLLGAMKEKESIEVMIEEAKSGSVRKRARVLEALGQTVAPEAESALLTAAYDEEPRLRISALLALEDYPEGRADLAIADGLRAPQWPVRSAAVHLLRRRKPDVAVPKLVDRLRPGVEQGRLLKDVHGALRRITNQRLGLAYAPWKRWLDQRDGSETSTEIPVDIPRSGTGSLAGVETYARRVLYVLAIHKSMGDAITVNPDKVAPRDVKKRGGKELQAWREAKTKIELARLWVAWSVERLSPEVHFNVVTYGPSANTVFRDLVPASAENREKAARRISSLSASGNANLHAGLSAGFTVLGKDPLDDRNLLEGPEVVFFVSDGYADIADSPDLTSGYRAFEEAERLNRFRQIRFHCFGVGGHDSRVLADLSGMPPDGAYVALP